jgi:hypothetical protein
MPEFDSTVEYRPIPEFPDYMIGSDASVWSRKPLFGAWKGKDRPTERIKRVAELRKTGLGVNAIAKLIGGSKTQVRRDIDAIDSPHPTQKPTLPWRQINPMLWSNGYLVVTLSSDTVRRKSIAVNCLMLSAFVGPRPEGMQCLHADDDKRNNSLTNLRWGTCKENHQDAIRNGRKPRGENKVNAKLTEADVRVIRRRLDAGDSEAAIARDFHVSKNPIRDIHKNITWRHVS